MKFFSVFIFTLCSIVSSAQFRTDTAKKVNYLLIPVLFKTPETGLAYGLSTSISFKTTNKNDTLTRISVVQVLGIFSQRKQNVQAIDGTIYFPKEKYILYAQISHSYFPDKYWGIGQTTLNTNEEKYAFAQVLVSPHLKRKITKHIFLGILINYQNVYQVDYIVNGIFDKTMLFGKQPYQNAGLGLSLSYDTRNRTFWPTKGIFFQTHYIAQNKNILATHTFNKWLIECRAYQKILKNHVLAAQFLNSSTYGETPLRSLISFGGADNMRGFYQGRFRDKAMYSIIAEYRAYLFWRLSVVAFGGIGDVYDKPKNINSSTLKYSFGGGIRLAILEKDKLNLRIDYGYFDNYNKGLYFTVGECF